MDVDVAGVEGGGAADEVDVPHADEFLAFPVLDFVMDCLEVLVPAEERLVVVAAQALDVLHAECVVVGDGDELAQGGEHAAREDVFAHEGVAHFLVVARDGVEEEESAVLEERIGTFVVGLVVVPADVLHHADAHDAVECETLVRQVAVVDEVDGYLVLETGVVEALLSHLPLLFAERAAVALDAVFLCGLDEQVAPAAADVEELHARLQVELLQDVVDLVLLRGLKRVVVVLEIGAGVAQRRVEPELVEVVAEVVVAGDLLRLVTLLLREGEEILERVLVERDAVCLLKQASDDREEVAVLYLEVAAHVRLREREGRRGHQFLFRDVVLHDDREFRVARADAVGVAVQFDVERVLVEPAHVVDEKTVQ